MNSKQIFQPGYSKADYLQFLTVQFHFLEMFEEKVFEIISAIGGSTLEIASRKKQAILQREFIENGYLPTKTSANGDVPLTIYQALGVLYVMEGSTLGGNIIKKNLQKNPSFENYHFAFLGVYGEHVGKFWKQLTDFLDHFTDKKEEILSGSIIAYDNLIRIAKKNYPEQAVSSLTN